jgi:hypothetical protein
MNTRSDTVRDHGGGLPGSVDITICVTGLMVLVAEIVTRIVVSGGWGLWQPLLGIALVGVLIGVELWVFRWRVSISRRWPWWVALTLVLCVVVSIARIRWERTASVYTQVCPGYVVTLRVNEEVLIKTDSQGGVTCVTSRHPTLALFKTYWDDPAFLWRHPK